MYLSNAEALRLREYLLRGGFLHVDDFWGLRQKASFESEMRKVFPDRELVQLDLKHEVFHTFFDMLGEQRTTQLRFIASDMWAAFRQVVRLRCSNAIHLLDRFHVMQLMSKAIDLTRRDEMHQLRAKGKHAILTKTRWILLKNPRNFTDMQRGRMRELLQCNLKSVRAFLLKQDFQNFWNYKAVWRARQFLDAPIPSKWA